MGYTKPIPLFLFLGFMVWIIVCANLGIDNIFVQLVHSIPFGDKLGHFCLVGLFTLLINRLLNHRFVHFFSIRLLVGSILVLIVTILEEFSQLAFITRTSDEIDIIADFLGILLFSWISLYYCKAANKTSC